jgi:hypothetical protein
MMVSGVGGLPFQALCGLIRLKSLRQFSIGTWASSNVVQIALLTLENRAFYIWCKIFLVFFGFFNKIPLKKG